MLVESVHFGLVKGHGGAYPFNVAEGLLLVVCFPAGRENPHLRFKEDVGTLAEKVVPPFGFSLVGVGRPFPESGIRVNLPSIGAILVVVDVFLFLVLCMSTSRSLVL